jgi:hypothetical protein
MEELRKKDADIAMTASSRLTTTQRNAHCVRWRWGVRIICLPELIPAQSGRRPCLQFNTDLRALRTRRSAPSFDQQVSIDEQSGE